MLRRFMLRRFRRSASCLLLPRRAASTGTTLKASLRVCFFGTDDFSLPTLLALHESWQGRGPDAGLVSELGVVSPGPRPAGGHGRVLLPVADFARRTGLACWLVPYGTKTLKDWDPGAEPGSQPLRQWDVGVVVSFGYRLPRHILQKFTLGAVNVHPSALPRYRGAAPIPRALLNGETNTAVSIILVDQNVMDGGEILLQVPVPIAPEDTAKSLTLALGTRGAGCLMEVLRTLPSALAAARKQDISKVTPAPKLNPNLGLLRWRPSALETSNSNARSSCDDVSAPHELTTEVVLRKWRALDLSSGIFAYFRTRDTEPPQRVKITKLRRPSEQELPPPVSVQQDDASLWGALFFARKQKLLWLRTADGWLIVEELHVQFKASPVSAHDFANGCRMVPGVPLMLE